MSDRGGSFTVAHSWGSTESMKEKTSPDRGNNHSGINKYDVRYLFNILLITFSSIPTTIFLAWIISWGVIILYLSTFGFAVGIACVTGLSMFLYGPVLCFCIISALGCSLIYNVSLYAWETVWAIWSAIHRTLYSLLASPSPTSTSISASGSTNRQEGTWGFLSWLKGEDNALPQVQENEGWGQMDVATEGNNWGTQSLEERFGTRRAAPSGILPTGPRSIGGMNRDRYTSAGVGTLDSNTGNNRRGNTLFPNEEKALPYIVR